jgi:hypothetical protein
MHKTLQIAIIFVAAYAIATGAIAQKVYKCGSSYSQIPCNNGASIEVEDTRTKQEKSAADRATQRDSKTADLMEKTRLKEERLAAGAPAKNAKIGAEAKEKAQKPTDQHKTKGKAPEFFTAKQAPEKKQP